MAVFVWRTNNVWGLQLIPAELQTVTEAVHDIQADTSRVFFQAYCMHFKKKNCMICWSIPAELVSETGVVPSACETAEGWDGMLAWKIKNVWYNATKIPELEAVLETFYDV